MTFTFCCSTASWDTQETQIPVSSSECHIQMACAVSKSLSPSVVAAWSFLQGRILGHSQWLGRHEKLCLQIIFSGCLKSIAFCAEICGGRARGSSGQYMWNLIHWVFSYTMPAAMLTKQWIYLGPVDVTWTLVYICLERSLQKCECSTCIAVFTGPRCGIMPKTHLVDCVPMHYYTARDK